MYPTSKAVPVTGWVRIQSTDGVTGTGEIALVIFGKMQRLEVVPDGSQLYFSVSSPFAAGGNFSLKNADRMEIGTKEAAGHTNHAADL
eukprot:COSAG02_NODE_9_length_59728_cov_36.104714_56_plen_88_part_00